MSKKIMHEPSDVFNSYYYEGTDTYVNKRNIRNRERLQQFEVDSVGVKILQMNVAPICGAHDLAHWQSIHRFMFSDIYDWAGVLRKIEVFTEFGSPVANPTNIENGFSTLVTPILDRTEHFRQSTQQTIAADIAEFMGELYYIHPFRDGNSRSLVQFTKTILLDAGIHLDLSGLEINEWHALQDGLVRAALERDKKVLEQIIAPHITIQHTVSNELQRGERNAIARDLSGVLSSRAAHLMEEHSRRQTEGTEYSIRKNFGNERIVAGMQDLLRPAHSPAGVDQAASLEDKTYAIQREHAHLLDASVAYTASLKTLVEAKEAQALRLENRLEAAVSKQQATVKKSGAKRPGALTSLWKGKSWERQHQGEQARLQTLERRLDRVRTVRTGMGGTRLEELARKKLLRQNPALVARRDAEEQARRARQFEEKQAAKQSQERQQQRGRGHKIER